MSRLSDTASFLEVENEIVLVEVMLNTLEPDDDNYEIQRADYEEYLEILRQLQNKLAAKEQSFASGSTFSAVPHDTSAFEHHSESASHSLVQGEPSDRKKRPHDGLHAPSLKYRRTSASTVDSSGSTPASQDSLLEDERLLEQALGTMFPRGNNSYYERARKQEEQCAREKADAEFARLLSSQHHGEPARLTNKMTQAMLSRDGHFQRFPEKVVPQFVSLPPTQANSTKLEPNWNSRPVSMSDTASEHLDGDISSDLEEISAADFTPRARGLPIPSSSATTVKYNPYQPMTYGPGAGPSSYYIPGYTSYKINPNVYIHNLQSIPSQSQSVYGNSMSTSSYLSSAGKLMSRVTNAMRPGSDDFKTLRGLVGGNEGSSRMPEYDQEYDLDDDLDARGWSHLLNDPAKTREELEALLRNIRPDEDLPKEMRIDTPEAMQFPLMEHQKLGLSWLKAQEEGSNKGGILADDMGLGKTIQALALIVSRPSEDPARKTTLIIGPVSLMRQWQREIQTKLRQRHALRVFLYHGQNKKASFARLGGYDVVLTTFGTVAAEYTRKIEHEARIKANPQIQHARAEFALLGDESRWYRVIIDEAQYIKNKATKSARAVSTLNSTYRLCMTGTPMMNNVTELYSLIHFLRIPPYNSYDRFMLTFGKPLKSGNEKMRQKAMTTFQALLKAVLLRRNKKSEIDGHPILSLPEKTIEVKHAVFSDDEMAFYQALETKTQLQVNKYLKAGTFGKNYSNILVLLLRLRQACCHPHLIKDHGVEGGGELPPEDMEDLARRLEETTISRIMDTGGAFECPVCYDAVENPTIFFPCGHDVCSECFARMTDPSQAIADGADSVNAKCPECRGKVDPKRVLNYMTFKKIHLPVKYEAETGESLSRLDAEEEMAGSGTDSDSDTDDDDKHSDADSQGDLKDFIVPDHEEIEENASEDDLESSIEKRNVVEKKRHGKSDKKGEGKGKAKKKEPTKTLAVLKKEAQRNIKAKKRYLRRLRREWVTSAKIEKTLEILREIRDTNVKEKTIIFSQFTSLLDLLEVPMDDEGWNYRRYDGSMSAKLRNDAVVDFMEKPEVKVMLVSLKAGNAGLNLTEASQVIILDPFWNPFVEEQAIDRAHRIGQQRPVFVHRILVESTVEDRICELQERKRSLINEALDEKASQNLSRLGQRELAYLFGISDTLPEPV